MAVDSHVSLVTHGGFCSLKNAKRIYSGAEARVSASLLAPASFFAVAGTQLERGISVN